MIQKILVIGLIMIALAACTPRILNKNMVIGSGIGVSEARTVGQFTQILVNGSPNVTISFGDMQSVVVGADDNILPLVETRVEANKLTVNLQEDTSYQSDLGIQVTIVVPALESVAVAGSGNVLVLGVASDHMEFDVQGSGTITAQGTAESLRATLIGSGKILSSDLQTKTANVTLDGSGDILVYATDSLKVGLDGSGNVRYRGNPAEVDQSENGSGSIAAIP